jgi:hypothetical protein
MEITHKTYHKLISYPVYPLPSLGILHKADGLLLLEGKIVDDTNQEGKTLGIRRMQTPLRGLYPLNKTAVDWISMIKCKNSQFIDSKGLYFRYEKELFVTLQYFKIERIDKKLTGCLLHLKTKPQTFILPRPPPEEMHYVGMLCKHNIPWKVYEYSETCLKDTRRKV